MLGRVYVKNRDVNLELLRVISMLSIVSLHYISQSSVREIIKGIHPMVFIMLQSYGRIACTVFFMISAWYLSKSSFSLIRIFKVWVAAVAYGILFWELARLNGWGIPDDYSFRNVLSPCISMPLWFVSIYIELLFLMPFLNEGINNIGRKSLRIIIFIPLVCMCMYSTVFRDDGRFIREMVFFPFVYMLMGYLRKYEDEIRILKCKEIWIVAIILSYGCICILQYSRFAEFVGWKELTEVGSYYRSRFWTLPNFLCAFSSFFFAKNISCPNFMFISLISSPTLGIYLIHQNPIFVNVLWEKCDTIALMFSENNGLIGIMLIILLVYIILGFVELLRVVIIEKNLINWICKTKEH